MSYRTVFTVSCTLMFLALAGVVSASDETRVVAIVNGAKLTEADLSQEVQAILPQMSSFHGGVSADKQKAIRTKALAALVEKELKYQDAVARKGRVAKDVLDAEIDKIKERYAKKGDFNTIIANAGFSPDSFRRLIERKILSEEIKVEVVDRKVDVPESALKAYYDQNREKYLKPQAFRVSQIFVKVLPSATPDERAKLKQKAESLLKEVKSGADFAAVAMRDSNDLSRIKGGDIGYFHEGQTAPEFEEAAKALQKGEISGVVATLEGYHILKLTDKVAQHQMQFDEVKEKIREQMKEKEEKRLLEQWLEGLKAKATITYPAEG